MKSQNRISAVILIGLFLCTMLWFAKESPDPTRAGDSVEIVIDNDWNVENYPYHFSRKITKNGIRLKDCEYSFLDHVSIPGMPMTRKEDFLNEYIFSESQCPQGLCFTDDFILVTSYSTEENRLGEILVFSRTTGEYLVTLGMDPKSHLGGIACDGKNVWVCNSDKWAVERISYDFVRLMAEQNRGKNIDATALVEIYPVDNSPSCIAYYNGRIWIGTHTLFFTSEMKAYYYNEAKNSLLDLSSYRIPAKVQGIGFGKDGRVYLSTSYGRNRSSYLMVYDSLIKMSAAPGTPSLEIEMPPASEEIDILDQTIYVLFESAGKKYYEGTDGKGTSTYPLDRILAISEDSIRE